MKTVGSVAVPVVAAVVVAVVVVVAIAGRQRLILLLLFFPQTGFDSKTFFSLNSNIDLGFTLPHFFTEAAG